jgi:hypothetical protein
VFQEVGAMGGTMKKRSERCPSVDARVQRADMGPLKAARRRLSERDADLLRRIDLQLHGWENVETDHLLLLRDLRRRFFPEEPKP